jgi:hypothetical protein
MAPPIEFRRRSDGHGPMPKDDIQSANAAGPIRFCLG